MSPLTFILIGLVFTVTPVSLAGLLTEDVAYQDEDSTELEGFFAVDDSFKGKRPVVIIAHDWTGLQDYEKFRARELAKLGYLVFAMDIYGKGVRPQNPEESRTEAMKYYGDRSLLRARAAAALKQVKVHDRADADKVAVIGYCFGGMTALEMARAGMDVDGVVSFHGTLNDHGSPETEEGTFLAKVLVLHGADDPHVPELEVRMFMKEMITIGADWQLVAYSGAVHSFTKKKAGSDPSTGAAYNAEADARSWQHMLLFFREVIPMPEGEEPVPIAPPGQQP